MKKLFTVIFGFIMLSSCASTGSSVTTISLEEAIHASAQEINEALADGVKVAVLNFTAPTERFSNYAIEELMVDLVREKKLLIVDRKELDLIREEMQFQLSGEVSDESAQSIGKLLGAQAIVSGALVSMGKTYRFRVKTLTVESGGIGASYSTNISAKDQQLVYLLSSAQAEANERARAKREADAKAQAEAKAKADAQAKAEAEAKSRAEAEAEARAEEEWRAKARAEGKKIYEIGDIGPGGGVVFFNKGGAYLEVSPLLGEYTWNDAVTAARNYKGGGYTDWRLPSQGELDLIYQNLRKKNLAGLGNDFYWSSMSEQVNSYGHVVTYSYYQHFSTGFKSHTDDYDYYDKDKKHHYRAAKFCARAVRAF